MSYEATVSRMVWDGTYNEAKMAKAIKKEAKGIQKWHKRFHPHAPELSEAEATEQATKLVEFYRHHYRNYTPVPLGPKS